MNIDLDRSFPVPVRIRHLETPESYATRLARANGMPANTGNVASRQLVQEGICSSYPEALEAWCDAKGGLAPGQFGMAAVYFKDQGYPERYMCRLCAFGQTIRQLDHAQSNCCLRHGLWTGPGTVPHEQSSLAEPVLKAERVYRRPRGKGGVKRALFVELSSILDHEHERQWTPRIFNPETYAEMIKLAEILTSPSFLRELLDPTKTFAQASLYLKRVLTDRLPLITSRLLDAIWLLVRPTFLLVRERLEGRELGIRGVIEINVDTVIKGRTVYWPLEPFGRYLDQRPVNSTGNVRDLLELHLVPGQHSNPRCEVRQGNKNVDFICTDGHRYRRSTATAAKSFVVGSSGCPYCAGQAVLAGFNSLVATYPAIAAQWHPTLNGILTPAHVSGAGNKLIYWWQCSEDHSWRTSPRNRIRGSDCPHCTLRIPIQGINTLDVTHPAVSLEWSYVRNGDHFPWTVTAGSRKKVWWVCEKAHEFQSMICNRTIRGSGCPVCANLKVCVGDNDLPTTHPWLVDEWDWEANGDVKPSDIVAGSRAKRHWICRGGHQYAAAPTDRIRGSGCPVCAGQRVLADYNSVVAIRPDLAAWWHPSLNGCLTPAQVTVHSSRKVFWQCILGHDFVRTISRFGSKLICPVCSGHQLLAGFNDVGTRYPIIAPEWHPTKNGGLTVRDLIPGNKRYWWLCANGHEQQASVPNRLKTGGCSKCAPTDRVAPKK